MRNHFPEVGGHENVQEKRIIKEIILIFSLYENTVGFQSPIYIYILNGVYINRFLFMSVKDENFVFIWLLFF